MAAEYWTERYSGRRLPPAPLRLRLPLYRAWKREPTGPLLMGALRTGDGDLFTNLGDDRPTRLSLFDGRTVWAADTGSVGAMIRRDDTLLVSGLDTLKGLRLGDGVLLWEKTPALGVADSFLIGSALVGAPVDCLRVLDGEKFEVLWSKQGRFHRTFCATEDVVVTWSLSGEGVACHDLRTGAVRWERSESDVGAPYLLGCIWQDKFINIQGQLKALDLATGRTLWEWEIPRAIHWWHPYDGRAYIFIAPGRYIIVDLATGKQLFERDLGPHVPVPVQKRKGGLRVVSGSRQAPSWQYVRLSVSETHTFLVNASGQILVLERDTGELVQTVELDGMPMMMEPIIYRNHLLISDFNAAIYCFKGAE